MHLAELIFLSIALGVDCMVVSFSQGLIFTQNKWRNSLALAVSMGLGQGLMPCFSYFGTSFVDKYVESYSSWLVFAIFMALGIKFIYEAFQDKEDKVCCLGIKCLIAMAIATSIDAFAAGISLKLTNTPILLSALIIGICSFVMSFGGFWFGNIFKRLPSKYLEIFGGLILIFLALKSVIL